MQETNVPAQLILTIQPDMSVHLQCNFPVDKKGWTTVQQMAQTAAYHAVLELHKLQEASRIQQPIHPMLFVPGTQLKN
jgi:hypothetical protein